MKTLKDLIAICNSYRKVMMISVVSTALSGFVELLYPVFSKRLINHTIYLTTENGMKELLMITLIFIGFLFLHLLNSWMHTVPRSNAWRRLMDDYMRKIYDKFQSLSHSWHDENSVGQTLSILDKDITTMADFVIFTTMQILEAVISFVGGVVVFSVMDPKLMIKVCPFLIAYVCFVLFILPKLRKNYKKRRIYEREICQFLEDRMNGFRAVTAFNNQQAELESLDKRIEQVERVCSKSYDLLFAKRAAVVLFNNLFYQGILLFGVYNVLTGKSTINDVMMFYMYSYLIMNPVFQLNGLTKFIPEALESIRKINEFLSIEEEIKNPEYPVIMDINGDIQFKNVCFHYKDQDVLKNISFHVHKGEYVALVGLSGSGKSTIANLIPRYYDIQFGSIKIDGVDIKSMDLGNLRKNIGSVQQDVYLFAGTIYDNIRYGKLDATEEEIIHAAKMANAHDFIMNTKDGYQSQVGEKGVKLSGGQKQRIAIARLFLANPPILIFDEATSALDEVAQKEVQIALEQVAKERTTIVIAHRLSTIQNADRILFLSENGIEEEDTHEELMRKAGKYAQLYTTTT